MFALLYSKRSEVGFKEAKINTHPQQVSKCPPTILVANGTHKDSWEDRRLRDFWGWLDMALPRKSKGQRISSGKANDWEISKRILRIVKFASIEWSLGNCGSWTKYTGGKLQQSEWSTNLEKNMSSLSKIILYNLGKVEKSVLFWVLLIKAWLS